MYAALMAVLFLVFFRDSSLLGILLGLAASGPLYLLLGYVLAKFGYQRQTLRQARANSRDRRPAAAPADTVPGPRPKPPPTKRTSGSGRPGGQRRR